MPPQGVEGRSPCRSHAEVLESGAGLGGPVNVVHAPRALPQGFLKGIDRLIVMMINDDLYAAVAPVPHLPRHVATLCKAVNERPKPDALDVTTDDETCCSHFSSLPVV